MESVKSSKSPGIYEQAPLLEEASHKISHLSKALQFEASFLENREEIYWNLFSPQKALRFMTKP